MILEITNFQSIEHCILDIPEEGFTCVVGPSNIGKSAIRRALETVLYNKGKASYISKWAKESSVKLTFNDGDEVTWHRNATKTWYNINGEIFKSLNKGVPDLLLKKGFKELSVNKEKINVQVAGQFDKVFLLNNNGSSITEILSNLGNLNKIIAANKKCSTDIKQKRSKLSVRKEDFKKLKSQIDAFYGLSTQRITYNQLLPSINLLKEKTDTLNTLKDTHKNYIKTGTSLKRLKSIVNIKTPSLDFDINNYENIIKLRKKYLLRAKILKTLKSLNVTLPSIDSNKYDNYKEILLVHLKYKKLYNNLQFYKKLKDISKDEALPNLDCYLKLQSIYPKYLNCVESIKDTKKEITSVLKALATLDKEKKDFEDQYKICPLCERSY